MSGALLWVAAPLAGHPLAQHAESAAALEELRTLFGFLEAMGALGPIVFDLRWGMQFGRLGTAPLLLWPGMTCAAHTVSAAHPLNVLLSDDSSLSVQPGAQPGLQRHHCKAQLLCLWCLLPVTPASFEPIRETQPGARPGLLHWRDLRSGAAGRQRGFHCRRRQVGVASLLHWSWLELV